MNFAVVEYTTKTGKIWKHTPEHPNYLGDPQREIDPTSFACYTSALEGEHIPLTSFIPRTFFSRLYKKLTGTWPAGYSLDYFQKFDVLLVVHQLSDAHEMVRFVRRVKKQHPHLTVLGVPTQPFGLLEAAWEKDSSVKSTLQEFAHACDAFISLTGSTVPAWEALTGVTTYYLPQPYPVEYTQQFFMERPQKENIIFVAGVTNRPRIALGHEVAAALQKRFPEYTIWITDTPGVPVDTSILENARYKVRPFEQWRQHLKSLQKMMLVINTDFTQTRGRVQVDAAAVGTPSLGSDSDGQADLFPDLAATPETARDSLVERGARLLGDATYYDRVVQTARAGLQKYNYADSAQRLKDLVKHIRHE